MLIFAILACVFLGLIVYQVRFAMRRRILAALSWDEVFARIEPLDLAGIRSIADHYLHPDRDQLSIEPATMWQMVGGLDGLSRMRANAAVMLELAVYAERWNDEEGPVVSEMIRRDAVRLNRAVTRIEVTLLSHLGFVRAPFHLQEVSASYYLIRSRLFGLYRNSHAGLLPRLEAAL